MSYYIPKAKYSEGQKVYITIGDIIIQGVVLKRKLDYDSSTYKYYVKHLLEYNDGFTRVDWYSIENISPFI